MALSRCTSLEGISLQEPIRHNEVFVRNEVKQFARQYNDHNIINNALQQSKADRQYHDASVAFDKGDMQGALDNFFLAIHSRYDIEKPIAKRFLRKKLNVVNELRAENEHLKKVIAKKNEEKKKQEEFLKRLATEYVVLGKECEKEHMDEAAINNYKKALELCPYHPEAKRRIKKLEKK